MHKIIFTILFFLILCGCGTWSRGDLAYLLDDRELEFDDHTCEIEGLNDPSEKICITAADPLITSSVVKIIKNDERNSRALVTRHDYYYHPSKDAWVSYEHIGKLDNWEYITFWRGPKEFSSCHFSGGCFNWTFFNNGRFILHREPNDDDGCAYFETKKFERCYSEGSIQIQGRLISLLVDSGERTEFFVNKRGSQYCWITTYERDLLECFEIKN